MLQKLFFLDCTVYFAIFHNTFKTGNFMMNVIGLDLGGTKLAGAVFNQTGEILFKQVYPLEKKPGKEAGVLIKEQITTPKMVDLIFKKGYGHKMGSLETADPIGLDTVVKSLDILYESYQDSKFRCCPLLRKMVDAGLLGKKSGKGFYEYWINPEHFNTNMQL